MTSRYIKDKKIGEGTYAVVYLGWIRVYYLIEAYQKGVDSETGKKVAIKKIRAGQFKDGLDLSAIREIKFLQELKHPNVIDVSLQLARGLTV